jgi:hypothetical protein
MLLLLLSLLLLLRQLPLRQVAGCNRLDNFLLRVGIITNRVRKSRPTTNIPWRRYFPLKSQIRIPLDVFVPKYIKQHSVRLQAPNPSISHTELENRYPNDETYQRGSIFADIRHSFHRGNKLPKFVPVLTSLHQRLDDSQGMAHLVEYEFEPLGQQSPWIVEYVSPARKCANFHRRAIRNGAVQHTTDYYRIHLNDIPTM